MFTQQCLIHKNTKEIINFLNEIGYTLYEGSDNFSKNVACSCKFNTYFTFDDDEYVFPNIIDCKKNKELFFAVAALRDDSDINQWFIMDAEIYKEIGKGDWFVATDIKGGKHVGTQIDPLYCHKATVPELIEHFNK